MTIEEKLRNIWKEIIPPEPNKPTKDPKDMDEYELAHWAATYATSIYPTGNRCHEGRRVETMVIHRHPKAAQYAKKRYAKQIQSRENGGVAIIFNTPGQVKRAIEHMTKKFEFQSIENWA